ncbi:MAG: hypothetical protein IPI83_07750 [Sphingomonadales bacterium]|nr:hypothetical protein [Sphingomonadales bacterium]
MIPFNGSLAGGWEEYRLPWQLSHPNGYNPGDNPAIYHLFVTFGLASLVFGVLMFCEKTKGHCRGQP